MMVGSRKGAGFLCSSNVLLDRFRHFYLRLGRDACVKQAFSGDFLTFFSHILLRLKKGDSLYFLWIKHDLILNKKRSQGRQGKLNRRIAASSISCEWEKPHYLTRIVNKTLVLIGMWGSVYVHMMSILSSVRAFLLTWFFLFIKGCG